MLDAISLQISTPQPESVVALQWWIIGILLAVIGYLYRQLTIKEREKWELVERIFMAFSDSSESIDNLAKAVEGMRQQLSILEAIEHLKESFRRDRPAD